MTSRHTGAALKFPNCYSFPYEKSELIEELMKLKSHRCLPAGRGCTSAATGGTPLAKSSPSSLRTSLSPPPPVAISAYNSPPLSLPLFVVSFRPCRAVVAPVNNYCSLKASRWSGVASSSFCLLFLWLLPFPGIVTRSRCKLKKTRRSEENYRF